MGHRNISCDGCNRQHFFGRRYKCLRCVNYDLCGDCYDQHLETHDHSAEHPMQLISELQVAEILVGGETLELLHMPNCYTCPYCEQLGLTAKQLVDHVVAMHRLSEVYVVCPMCAGLPGIELVAIRNLARHLQLNHIEHANQLDPDTPPLRRALGRSLRRRRRLGSGNINLNINSSTANGSSMDTEAGIDILYQLNEMRRPRAAESMSTSWSSRQALDNMVDISEDETRSRSASLSAATESFSTESTRIQDELTPSLSATHVPVEGAETEKYLLLQWMTAEQQRLDVTEQRTSQRYQHGIFTEHLLLSMLCDDELRLAPPERELQQEIEQPKIPGQQQCADLKVVDERQLPRLSKIMLLMLQPWANVWQGKRTSKYINVEGATLDESELNAQEDID